MSHSQNAVEILKSLPIVGYIGEEASEEVSTNDGEVSWQVSHDKGLLIQMWQSKDLNLEKYIRYIQSPKVLINPIREVILFESPILERFTKTPWYAIPIIWTPLTFYYLYLSIQN